MTPVVALWRIGSDTPDYEAHDLSGKGAEVTGGRWNRKGTPIVYASVSRALACLESVVHMAGTNPLPLNRYLVRIDIPGSLWDLRSILDPEQQVGWDAEPAGRVSMNWGTTWAQRSMTLLAEVPSVIVAEESNVLINPRHPDISQLVATKVRKWTYNRRIR